MARAPMLTKERYERLVWLIKQGNYKETAAAEVGITSHTLRKWLRWGAEGRQPYKKFGEDLHQAEAAACNRHVMRITLASKSDWRAAAFILRTKYPELWGDKISVNIQDGMRAFVEKAQHVLEPTQFAKLLAAITSEGLPGEAGGDREADRNDR